MKTIPFSQLRANLTRYVKLAQAGESIGIARRGKVIAQLNPLEVKTKTSVLKRTPKRVKVRGESIAETVRRLRE